MPPTKMDDDAFAELKNLATWIHEGAEMEQEKNLIKCVDERRYDKTLPLLEALGYAHVQVISITTLFSSLYLKSL